MMLLRALTAMPVCAAVLSIGLSVAASAATPCDPAVAKMVSVQGSVEIRRAGQAQAQPARLNDTYCAGDQIVVGERSRADVVLANQPVVRLDQNTTLTVGGAKREGGAIIQLIRGVIYFFSRLPRNLEVNTTYVNAGVEGTEGLIAVDANQTLVSIFEGRTALTNAAGSLTIVGGQSAVADAGRAPILTVVARPRDSVRWALYYVPTLYFRAADFAAGPDWQGTLRSSIEALNRRDYAAAFEAMRNLPANLNEAKVFTYRAALLLAVGRYDEASRDLERALSLHANDSDALALQAIVSVVHNEKDRALEFARRAATADPRAAAALIALSYAQQANFDLDGALASLQQAVQVSPDNPLAWARLAEGWLMFGQLSEALAAAQKAVALEANLARTQSVLGFAFLTQVNTSEARRAFERAIELDQADPLPRLGLGLGKIRDGELIDGRKELDIAVSLDPDNALIRSYLGKAYFEEKRDKQAADQYQMAKQLDPRDPTPYFYDAIRKQTTNRPVEALQDLQKAIELNDNRAVYRSRQLLDSDAAARSAALGRIYSDLGFQQLALVEGWKSVNTDPANFSAHRLLADSYSVLPRHEIARVSELLQSQLLQPLNATPIQSRLAESNLFLIGAGGPAGLSYNEFSPIFNRNGVNFQTTALVGENKTYSGEGVLAGIYKRLAFSLGGFHYQTEGFRRNAGQKDNIGNAFLQFDLTPQTSVQGEYRYRKSQRGDIRLRFFEDEVFPAEENRTETQTARFGLRHNFSPSATLLASVIHQNAQFTLRENLLPQSPLFTYLDLKSPQTSTTVELQQQLRWGRFSAVGGVGFVRITGRRTETFATIFPPPFDLFDLRSSTNRNHTNVYLYPTFELARRLQVTLGVSGDFIGGDSLDFPDKQQFNPKVGVVWNPSLETTLRAAAFRVLKRTLITDQTIEPTQVAGFNQFFDDINGASSWRYGVAADQKFSRDLFGGLELSRRDIKSPITVNGAFDEDPIRELLSRAYLFWMPHPWLTLRSEYSYLRYRSSGIGGRPIHSNTHTAPLGVQLFHTSGLSAKLGATYYNQAGRFASVMNAGTSRPGQDSFWTADGSISYRLPDRYGLLTIGATNLFDRQFKFFDLDTRNPSIQPRRQVFGKITFALP